MAWGITVPARKVVNIVKKILSLVSLFAMSGVLGIQLVQPASAVSAGPSPAGPILIGAQPDAHVSSLNEEKLSELPFIENGMAALQQGFPRLLDDRA